MKQHKLRAGDMALIGMFAALMAVGANITSLAPFLQVAGIPLSMQPFFCLLAALLLGSKRAAIAMIVYALVGLAGSACVCSIFSRLRPVCREKRRVYYLIHPGSICSGMVFRTKHSAK